MRLVQITPDPVIKNGVITTVTMVPTEQVAYQVDGVTIPAKDQPELLRNVIWSLFKDLGCIAATCTLVTNTDTPIATGTDGETTYEVFLEAKELQFNA